MTMNSSTGFAFRLTLLLTALLIPAEILAGQSGRSWMKGFVFADSDTRGLPAATVELVGDQNNDRLRSVRLTATTAQDGAYSIQNIPYGDYTFRVSSPGYESYEIKLYIGSDMLTQIHVKLKRKK